MLAPDTLAVSSLQLLLAVAGQYGADVPALQHAIAFDPSQGLGPDARVPLATVQQLWPLVITATGDPYFDLHLGSRIDFATAGTLAYVLMHAPTLGAAIVQLCRYQDIACEGVRTSLHVAPEYAGGARLTLELQSPAIVYPRHVLNSELSVYLAAFRTLTGQPVIPRAVELPYAQPTEMEAYTRVFGTQAVAFEKPLAALTFDAATLALPIPHANPALFPLFEQHAAALLAQLPSQAAASLPEQVRYEIIRLFKGEVPTLAAVADRLHLGVRALQLKLKSAGCTYQQVLEEVRRELAQRHLREAHLSITDIAFVLGYSETSVFVRSFKKWTGLTPGAFRK